MLKIKHSQNINVLFLIRFFVLYVSVSRAVVRAEWRSAQPGSSAAENTDEHWKTTKREEHSPSFFFICAWFQGGRELVSTAINLISAIKITPPSPSTIFPWKATLNVLINVLRCCFKPFQPASFALSIPQSEDIIHFFQKAGNVLFNLPGV